MPMVLPPRQIGLIVPTGGSFDFMTDVAMDRHSQTLVINAPFNDTDANGGNSKTNAGCIYICDKYSQKQKVVPKETWREANAVFGHHVAISEDNKVIVASARGQTVNGLSGAGAVYILKQSEAGVWKVVRRVVSQAPGTDYKFGFAVDIGKIPDGNYVIAIGEPFASPLASEQGQVWVVEYDYDANEAYYASRVRADNEANSSLGYTLRVSNDGYQIVVGMRKQSGDPAKSGVVGMISLNPFFDSWDPSEFRPSTFESVTDELRPPSPDTAAYYGISESTSPDTFAYTPLGISSDISGSSVFWDYVVCIGGHGWNSGVGVVDIYEWVGAGSSGSFISLVQYTGTAGQYFGGSMAISRDGKAVLIGVQEYDNSESSNEGGVYLIICQGDDPTVAANWPVDLNADGVYFFQPDTPSPQSYFGYDLAFSDNHIAVVASDYNSAFSDIGAVYTFELNNGATVSATDTEAQKPVNVQIEELQLRVPGEGLFKKVPYE